MIVVTNHVQCTHYSVATLFLQINICETVKINYKTVKVQSFFLLLTSYNINNW